MCCQACTRGKRGVERAVCYIHIRREVGGPDLSPQRSWPCWQQGQSLRLSRWMNTHELHMPAAGLEPTLLSQATTRLLHPYLCTNLHVSATSSCAPKGHQSVRL